MRTVSTLSVDIPSKSLASSIDQALIKLYMMMDEQRPSDREQGPGAVVHAGVPPHPVPGGLPHHAHRVLKLRPQASQLLREQPHPQAAAHQGG